VVITDGENHEGGAVEAAKEAAKKGIQVNVLGVGLPDGAPIPIEGSNDFRRDREGNVIVTRLNEAMCQEIAKEENNLMFLNNGFLRSRINISTNNKSNIIHAITWNCSL